MEVSQFGATHVFKTRIYLEKDATEGDFVELREFNKAEMHKLVELGQKTGAKAEAELASFYESMFIPCLVDHSFTENGEKASAESVFETLKQSGSLFYDVLAIWAESSPFSKRLRDVKSDKPESSSLPA